jgi:hypothetical protein
VRIEREKTLEHEAMETRRRPIDGLEYVRLAQREPKRHRTSFFAEQRGLVTDR